MNIQRTIHVQLTAFFIMITIMLMLLSGCGSDAPKDQYSWDQKFVAAQNAAKVKLTDQNPIVSAVIAEPVDVSANVAEENNLKYKVQFLTASGQSIEVCVKDLSTSACPSGDLSNVQPVKSEPLPESEIRRLNEAWKYVQLSPLLALEKTLTEGASFSKERNIKIDPLVVLWTTEEIRSRFQVPAVWRVEYLGAVDGEDLVVWVDAKTGEILEQNHE